MLNKSVCHVHGTSIVRNRYVNVTLMSTQRSVTFAQVNVTFAQINAMFDQVNVSFTQTNDFQIFRLVLWVSLSLECSNDCLLNSKHCAKHEILRLFEIATPDLQIDGWTDG